MLLSHLAPRLQWLQFSQSSGVHYGAQNVPKAH